MDKLTDFKKWTSCIFCTGTLDFIPGSMHCSRPFPYFGGQFCPIFGQEKVEFLPTTVRTLFNKNSLNQFYIRLCVKIFN